MTSLLVILHVLAAVLLIGPVCVATSAFPGQMFSAANGEHVAVGAARILHKITNTYGYISAIVPVLGVAVFLTDLEAYKSAVQFHIAILLAVIAWCLLFFLIVPKQKKAIAALDGAEDMDAEGLKKQLSAFSGIFNLLWMICAILMFV